MKKRSSVSVCLIFRPFSFFPGKYDRITTNITREKKTSLSSLRAMSMRHSHALSHIHVRVHILHTGNMVDLSEGELLVFMWRKSPLPPSFVAGNQKAILTSFPSKFSLFLETNKWGKKKKGVLFLPFLRCKSNRYIREGEFKRG